MMNYNKYILYQIYNDSNNEIYYGINSKMTSPDLGFNLESWDSKFNVYNIS